MEEQPGLARRLGTTDAVVIGLGSMIGAGVFSAFGPAARAAGAGLLIGLGLAAAIAYCNATASAQLAAVYPTSGGTYIYGRERLGADHPATIRTATALSIALRRLASGRADGLQIAEETHEVARKRHGEVHPDTLAAAMNRINSLRTNGVIAPALELADVTANAYPDVYGNDHPYYYGCLGNLALMRRVVGEKDEGGSQNILRLRFAPSFGKARMHRQV